jgi:hypothetical protein
MKLTFQIAGGVLLAIAVLHFGAIALQSFQDLERTAYAVSHPAY